MAALIQIWQHLTSSWDLTNVDAKNCCCVFMLFLAYVGFVLCCVSNINSPRRRRGECRSAEGAEGLAEGQTVRHVSSPTAGVAPQVKTTIQCRVTNENQG